MPVIMETHPNHWLQFVSSLQDPIFAFFVIYLVDFNVITFWIMRGLASFLLCHVVCQPIHISKGRILVQDFCAVTWQLDSNVHDMFWPWWKTHQVLPAQILTKSLVTRLITWSLIITWLFDMVKCWQFCCFYFYFYTEPLSSLKARHMRKSKSPPYN